MNILIKRHSIADNTFEALGIKTEYQTTFHYILYIITAWVVGTIILIFSTTAWMYYDVGFWALIHTNVCINFPILINSVVDLTFASFVRQVICFLKK